MNQSEMPAIPLPFVVVLLLVILAVRLVLQSEKLSSPAFIFLCASIFQTTLVGFRWSSSFAFVHQLQPVAAATIPPIAWLAFSHLFRAKNWPSLLHFLPALTILALTLLQFQSALVVDLILLSTYLGYGLLLFKTALSKTIAFENARLTDVQSARKAVLFVGGFLIASATLDVLIAIDFRLTNGQNALGIVSLASMITLPLVAYAVIFIDQAVPDRLQYPAGGDLVEETAPPPDENDERIMLEFDAFMQQMQLYRDPDLTLNRLSRRMRIPARQLSNAINRCTGKNVSQVVNEYRISEVARALRETDAPVTSLMFDCGFQTKSNFNREFRKIMKTSPSEYRRQHGSGT